MGKGLFLTCVHRARWSGSYLLFFPFTKLNLADRCEIRSETRAMAIASISRLGCIVGNMRPLMFPL